MNSLWILLILFIIMRVLAANSKEKAAQAKRRAQAHSAEEEAAAEFAPPPPPPQPPQPSAPQSLEDIFPTLPPTHKAPTAGPRRARAEDVRFPEPTAQPQPARPPQQEGRGYGPSMGARPAEGSAPSGSMQARPTEGHGFGRSMRATPTEGKSFGGSMPVPEAQANPAIPRHTVKPLTESAHAHRESSISGIEDCAGDAAAIASAEAAAAGQTQPTANAPRFPFDRASLRQGFLYGELLGPPKALRRQTR